MDFVLKLAALVILFYLVQSGETSKVLKSIKLNEKIIYDCVDMYKQPSLNHPLLRNHQIQMKPSFSIPRSKIQFESKMFKKIIECPNGTVPILRNTKEYVENAQYLAKTHFNPLTAESQGTHFAGFRLQAPDLYHGVTSVLSRHDLNISRGQISYAQLYAGSRINNKDNYIQTGYMGANGSGCYNTMCPGFVQVSTSHSLFEPVLWIRYLTFTIERDLDTGNWWAIGEMHDKGYEVYGYWPKELFDLLDNGVKTVGVGGAVEFPPSGISPPMGMGSVPEGDDMDAARVTYIRIRDSHSFEFKKIDKSKLEKVLDSKICYDVRRGKHQLFTYGGRGGRYC